MPTEHDQKLNEGLDPQEKNSVYDFLYHDVHRISSFLSQFDPNGYLQSSRSSKSLSQTRNSSSEKSLKGKLPAVVEAETARKYANSEVNINDISKTYDPLWQNSLAFLDYLDHRKLIKKEIANSRIGQFVLISGQLFIFNMGYMQKLLKGERASQAFVGNFNKTTNDQTIGPLIIEIIGIMPESIQAKMKGEDFNTWSTLKEQGLSISSDDLLLKHGSYISGDWKMLGILDALPEDDNNIENIVFPALQQRLIQLSQLVRPEFGRPAEYYGITPLLVFREVSGN